MTKLAGVCAPRLDGNRRALKRRDAFQIDQTRREISLLTTLLRDEWRERERERERKRGDEWCALLHRAR